MLVSRILVMLRSLCAHLRGLESLLSVSSAVLNVRTSRGSPHGSGSVTVVLGLATFLVAQDSCQSRSAGIMHISVGEAGVAVAALYCRLPLDLPRVSVHMWHSLSCLVLMHFLLWALLLKFPYRVLLHWVLLAASADFGLSGVSATQRLGLQLSLLLLPKLLGLLMTSVLDLLSKFCFLGSESFRC